MNRRQFVYGAGISAIAQVLGHLPQAEAQVITAPNGGFFRNGDTIKDPLLEAHIDGWTVTYESNEMQEAYLVGEFTTGFWRGRGQNSQKLDAQAFPSDKRDFALLVVQDKSAAPAPRAYPIKLEFEGVEGDNQGWNRRVYVEPSLNLDKTVLQEILQMHNQFDNLLFATVPLSVHIYKETDPTQRLLYPDSQTIRMPSVVLSKPIVKDEGLARIYHELASVLVKYEQPFAPNMAQKMKLNDAWIQLMSAIGFDPSLYRGLDRPSNESPENYYRQSQQHRQNMQQHPIWKALNVEDYLGNNLDVRSEHGRPPYHYQDMFASVLTVLRFRVLDFLERHRSQPDGRNVLNVVGQATLDYVDSLVRNELQSNRQLGVDPKVANVVPHYKILKEAFNR